MCRNLVGREPVHSTVTLNMVHPAARRRRSSWTVPQMRLVANTSTTATKAVPTSADMCSGPYGVIRPIGSTALATSAVCAGTAQRIRGHRVGAAFRVETVPHP